MAQEINVSLESSIADLVSAANNLTNSVNGKMAAIDQSVALAVAAVPKQITGQMRSYRYVDGVAGNDANSGDSSLLPKKTLGAAVLAIPSGGYGVIVLKSGSVYSIGSDIEATNKTVYIIPDSYTYSDRSTYTEIRSEPGVSADGRLFGGGFFLGMKGMIHILGCRLTTAKYTAAHAGKPQDIWTTSFFKTNSSLGHVILQHCAADIWNGALFYQHSSGSFGKADVLMRNVMLSKMDISTQPVNTGYQLLMGSYGNSPIPYSMYGVEMVRVGFPTWASAISGDLTNVITNLKD